MLLNCSMKPVLIPLSIFKWVVHVASSGLPPTSAISCYTWTNKLVPTLPHMPQRAYTQSHRTHSQSLSMQSARCIAQAKSTLRSPHFYNSSSLAVLLSCLVSGSAHVLNTYNGQIASSDHIALSRHIHLNTKAALRVCVCWSCKSRQPSALWLLCLLRVLVLVLVVGHVLVIVLQFHTWLPAHKDH